MIKKRVLVIDDEPGFTRVVRLNLEKTGLYEVREVNDSSLAISAAREFMPQLILLDVVMPGVDGGDVALLLKRDAKLKNVPVVFLTAIVGRQEAGRSGLISGGAVFLAKPITGQDLIRCIEENLAA